MTRRAAAARGAVVWAALAMIAYGSASLAAPFDAGDNAFRYAGEYRDPQWGGVYLRARWYHPDLPSFVSRDAARHGVSRYGYAGGDPLMRVDPSGAAFRHVGRGLGRGLDRANAGVGGHFARLLAGQFLVPLQILADPRGFWRQVRRDSGGIDALLAAGVAVEAFGYFGTYSGFARTAIENSGSRYFWMRTLGEGALGAGQAAASSLHHGRLDGGQLVAGLESIVGPELLYRIGGGIGYQPYTLHTGDVDRILGETPLRDGEALIFRVREQRLSSGEDSIVVTRSWTSPLLEAADLGLYHEALIAVTTREVALTEIGVGGYFTANWQRLGEFVDDTPMQETSTTTVDYLYVGKMSHFDREAFFSNPRNHVTPADRANYERTGYRRPRRDYDVLRNNCHHHASGVLAALGMR